MRACIRIFALTIMVLYVVSFQDLAHGDEFTQDVHFNDAGYILDSEYMDSEYMDDDVPMGDGVPMFDSGYCDTSCDAMGCCDPCEPLWTASYDAIFLHRSDPASAVLGLNTVNSAESFNAADFDFGTHTGFDFSLLRRIDCNHALELRYFGVDHWTANAVAATTRDDLLQFNAEVPIFADAGDAIASTYNSQLHNTEINVRNTSIARFDLLVGFRYMELDEHIHAGLINAAIPFDYDASTNNRMYGGQLGAQAWLWDNNRLSLDVFGKVGVYGNHASHTARTTTGVATTSANGRGNPTSFIGELGLNGAAQLNDHFSIRGGYRLLWVDRVALASNQLAVSDFFAGTGFHARGDVFYHGASAGVEFAY